MRLLESIRITIFKREVPALLLPRALLFENLLRHHVELGGVRQRRAHRRFLSRLLTYGVGSPFLNGPAMSRAMSVKSRHATYDKRQQGHQDKETNRFKLLAIGHRSNAA